MNATETGIPTAFRVPLMLALSAAAVIVAFRPAFSVNGFLPMPLPAGCQGAAYKELVAKSLLE